MLVVILLTLLAFVLPLVILRSFSLWQKILVFAIIVGHLAVMFFLHYRLVRATHYPEIIDIHADARVYYENTLHFRAWPPFTVTRQAAIDAAGGSKHFGYHYVLGTLWTISSDPMLAMRLLKTMLFLTGLSCLARVWRTDYGSQLATAGFAFMGVVCTPAFYYNYRNLKDGLILALFLFIMALLDTLLRRREERLHPMGAKKTVLAWFTVIVLLYILSTIRLYTVAIIVVAVVMHTVMTIRLGLRQRVLLLVVLSIIVALGFTSNFIANVMELSGGVLRKSIFTLRGVLQAFLSPLPWGMIRYEEPSSIPFYSLYWLLLPYALYTLVKNLRNNINWHLFLYIMVTYVVGVVIGDPPRKRLILYPILVTWVLAHLAYKRLVRAEQAEHETEATEAIESESEYSQEYIQTA